MSVNYQKYEKAARDRGRKAVRAIDEISSLKEQIKNAIANGSEYSELRRSLYVAYLTAGKTKKDFEAAMSAILGKPYTWGARDPIVHSDEEYFAAINAIDDYIEHGKWQQHKYVKIVNGRYIYPDDLEKAGRSKQNEALNNNNVAAKYRQEADAIESSKGKTIANITNAVLGTNFNNARAANAKREHAKELDAEAAVDKYQGDGMVRTAQLQRAQENMRTHEEANKTLAKAAGEALSIASEMGKAAAKTDEFKDYMDKMTIAYATERLGELSDQMKKEAIEAKEQGDEAFIAWINETAKKANAKASQLSHSDPYYAALDEIDNNTEMLAHHGILGMKWGIRRYQNPDGSLTELGKKHLEDGRTQKVIDKFNQKKSIALAKGDVEFARKHMDYLSNDELSKFKERITARTQLDDLKQASRKVTADKLQTWANMAQSGANLLSNGINAYNSAAKIVNSITGKQTIPVLKDIKENDNQSGRGNSVLEVYRNGRLETREEVKTNSDGSKTTTKKHFNTKDDKDKDKDKDKKKGK